MNNKILKGQAQLVAHIEDAAQIALRGGNVYIAATRDGLRGNRRHSPNSEVLDRAITWIQSRVEANNIAHKSRLAEAQPEPNLDLAADLVALAKTIRTNSEIGNSPITRNWGQAIMIGDKAWHQI